MKNTLEFLKLLNEHIPINRTDGFKGNHGITLKDNKLIIGYWLDHTDPIPCTDEKLHYSWKVEKEDLDLSPLELVLKIKNNI